MSYEPRGYCPSCRTEVAITRGKNIAGHYDTTGKRPCPSTGEPYDTTIPRTALDDQRAAAKTRHPAYGQQQRPTPVADPRSRREGR